MAPVAAITTSAPGSLMLLGEHAVLHGHRALVGAINQRIMVALIPLSADTVEIHSALGEYKAPLDALIDHPSFRFVLHAVERHRAVVSGGFRLDIESDFSADIGFGSSAAVTVATHAALMAWTRGEAPAAEAVFQAALDTVQSVQGRGSGADLAASVFGGIVAYTIAPTFDSVEIAVPLTAVYSGYKTPTPEVIAKVEAARAEDPERFASLYEEVDVSVADAVEKLRQHDLPGFGQILNRNHELMRQMGVETPELERIVAKLQAEPDVFGAKISGSGLGDCAVGMGYTPLEGLDFPTYHLEISPAGVLYDD